MKIEAYKCDVCGVGRGPSNHWLLADIHGTTEESSALFYRWDDELNDGYMKHICGQGCASILLGQTIESWSKTEAPHETQPLQP
jgi:hypothetical protein